MSKKYEELIQYLQDIGSCWRCATRFTQERNPNSYRKNSIDAVLKQEPEEKISKISPCILCLGLVQDHYIKDEDIDNICRQVMEAGYDSPTFTCMVSLPVSLMLRDQSVWFSLVEKFPQLLAGQKLDFVTSLKDVWKFLFAQSLEAKLGKKFEFNSSLFQIQIHVLYKDETSECNCLVDMYPEKFKHRYNQTRVFREGIFTRNAVQGVLSSSTVERFNPHYELKVPNVPFHYGDVQCIQNSIFIAGRYNKFSRTLSQTPWVIDGKKHMETSVQELICDHIEPFFKVKSGSSKFQASGREDVDVRTLGLGRPFAIELIDPHRTRAELEELADLQKLVNKSTDAIMIRDLQMVTKDQLAPLKEGEEEKTKIYSALCVTLDGPNLKEEEVQRLDGVKDLVLMQKTPLRVLHRRPLAVRPRTVHEMRAELLPDNPGHFVVHLKTQAGTYIKEFVHGDFNRTVPNLCILMGRPVDIVALDVDAVELNWPPSLSK